MASPMSRVAPTILENSPHLSEMAGLRLSQSMKAERDGRASLADTFVMLCDWRGRSTWMSGGDFPVKVGEFIWEHLSPESRNQAKLALGQVIAIRESQELEVVYLNGDRFRGWLWPLDTPDVAVCILGSRIPGKLSRLSERERDVLDWLAQGLEPRAIAESLDISGSTVHTHLKHAREKLGLRSLEALISFAARYCYPVIRPENAQRVHDS
jgi:DNA-binding CsgD family transcriptional regulator